MAQIETLRRNSGQEYALVEFVERLGRHREGRIAVHIHLSRLQPHNRREHHIRLAFSTFDNFVAQHDGQTFMLRNNDIVFIGAAKTAKFVENAVIRLRYLFSEDALVQLTDDKDELGFCTWYVVERDYDGFLALCRRFFHLAQTNFPDLAAEPTKAPLDAKNLAKLEELLAGADLANLIRHQPVCAIGDDLRAERSVPRSLCLDRRPRNRW